MMQIVPKWKVAVTFESGKRDIELWVSDTCMSNVLRKIADLSFSENGLEQPSYISVVLVGGGMQSASLTSTSPLLGNPLTHNPLKPQEPIR